MNTTMIVYLAHDLRTLLTSVTGCLALLRDEGENSAALRHKYLRRKNLTCALDVPPNFEIRRDVNKMERVFDVLSPNRPAQHLLELDGAAIKVTPIDIVFPVPHGQKGEDGALQSFCAPAGIPVVG